MIVIVISTCNNNQMSWAMSEDNAQAEFSIEKKWVVSGLSNPESVLVIPQHDWLYVSNVNGEEHDGYISRLSKDGKIDTLKWVEGIRTPTGMGFYKGNIYVADQTQLHVIDIQSGTIIQSFPSQAKTLNDISITKEGRIFVSDLTTGSIYTVVDNIVVLWLHSTEFATPNGVLVQGDNLIIGTIGTELSLDLRPDQYGSLYRISLTDKSVKPIHSAWKICPIDGVVAFEDGVIISDPMAGKLIYVTEEKNTVLLDGIKGEIADIGIDSEKQIIYAPLMVGNKVVAYQVNKK